MQKKKGRILWGNAILYSSRVPLAAGHSDDVSLTDDPAKGWGWLADKGFDIIQTDWTKHCVDYLKEIIIGSDAYGFKFLGCGSAFNPLYGNTSAYFTNKDQLYVIDGGESVF